MSDKEITKQDLVQLEKFADKLFNKVGIDINFTRHFLDRANDERNKKQITMGELTRLFKQTYKKYGKKMSGYGPDFQAVLHDLQTNLNMPFVLVWDKDNDELDLVAKTVMRKNNFQTSNPKLQFESYEKVASHPVYVKGYGELDVDTAQKSVTRKIKQLAALAESGTTKEFRHIARLLDDGVLQAILAGLNTAYEEIEADPELSEYLQESNCKPVDTKTVKEAYKKYKKAGQPWQDKKV